MTHTHRIEFPSHHGGMSGGTVYATMLGNCADPNCDPAKKDARIAELKGHLKAVLDTRWAFTLDWTSGSDAEEIERIWEEAACALGEKVL